MAKLRPCRVRDGLHILCHPCGRKIAPAHLTGDGTWPRCERPECEFELPPDPRARKVEAPPAEDADLAQARRERDGTKERGDG